MSLRSKVSKLGEIADCLVHEPKLCVKVLGQVPAIHRQEHEERTDILSLFMHTRRGVDYARQWESTPLRQAACAKRDGEHVPDTPNPLKDFFSAHKKGKGIWKWEHYFEIYHRHFSKFVGREANVLEIGIYSGGSLEMWRHYFGSKCHIYGVDIAAACKCYEDEHTSIFVGDQADRGFWKEFKEKVAAVDVVIDDGGHEPEQQIVTLEEMLPHLRPGGVYLCEDITGMYNAFSAFVQGLQWSLNDSGGSNGEEGVRTNGFQSRIGSIHSYPYVTVIEKCDVPVHRLIAQKHGTEWQPFL